MNERPILMKTDMVKAILEGRKTQTRRVIKPQPLTIPSFVGCNVWISFDEHARSSEYRCPYGQVGDKLWVRETFRYTDFDLRDAGELPYHCEIEYKADGYKKWVTATTDAKILIPDKWRPSIFMPRWASRITLEITDIRVQRVQEISEDDALAEGILLLDIYKVQNVTAKELYQGLWNSINLKRCYGWDKNPYVWVISFSKEG